MARIRRLDGAPPVAWLASTSVDGAVIELREGRTFVGRPSGATEHDFGALHAVEAAQWFIRCEGRSAHVADASSTNLSRLERGSVTVPLVHPNEHGGTAAWVELRAGDRLVCVYGTFVFDWAEASAREAP
jgi:hypothetical protein